MRGGWHEVSLAILGGEFHFQKRRARLRMPDA